MADSILTSGRSSSSSPLDPPSRIICNVCQKQFSKYTCPRCNSRYCSLHCYKSHSLRCTESFMKENVVEELRQVQPSDETKRKMLQILKRLNSEDDWEMDSMDEDDSTLSEEFIRKVLSGCEVSFDDLSPEERKRFQRAVASGELSRLIKPWDPWWLRPSARTICLSKEGTQLVQPLTDQEASCSQSDNQEAVTSREIPTGPETPLPPLSTLSSASPSPLLVVHLVDILYSYCFTLRVYNGDWRSDAAEASMTVLTISSVLGQNRQPETVREALSYCLEQTCSPSYRHMGGLQFGLRVIEDVICLLSLGAPALICLLCDVRRMIQAGEREVKTASVRKSMRSGMKTKLKMAERKIYFMMCWVHEQPREAWAALASIVSAEKSSGLEARGLEGFGKREAAAKTQGRVFVEEMG